MKNTRQNGRPRAERLDDMEASERLAHLRDVRWLEQRGHHRAAAELADFHDLPRRMWL